MRPTIKKNGDITVHRNGDISLWDVYRQQQRRLAANVISDEVLASLTNDERERIAEAAEKLLIWSAPSIASAIALSATPSPGEHRGRGGPR